jgi:two-component system NarL family response regulator
MNSEAASLIRILIADDHRLVRLGIVALLEGVAGLTVVAEAESGEEAVARFREHRPDICLMDLRMPGMSGYEAIRAILEEQPDAKILVLSTYDGDEDIHRALEIGARGYVFKDITRPQLAEAVHTVFAGQQYLAPAVRQKLAERENCSSLSAR